ncbi:MAG TPA: NYN domain-containing protein [Candidatus Paceibacterota bacterium]|nr:NYN domain-containing protein [Candidatus Paceibacterota bacterium]
MKKNQNNYAFIDGQNLYFGTTTASEPWQVDLKRFRFYLKRKYNVCNAYYFLGYVQDGREELYEKIQSAGFILNFREHNSAMLGKKKGNVDTDIVFTIMKKLYKQEDFDKIILVSGDGDYRSLVDFLIEENKLGKILFPDQKRASSLYKKIDTKFQGNLGYSDVRRKIEQKKRAP